MRVHGISEMAQIIEYNNMVENHIKKAKKAIKKDRIAELKAQGIDPEIAEVMASVGL